MITDPWRTWYYAKRNTWILMRGDETVYTEPDRYLREWDTEAEAKEWAEQNLAGRKEWNTSST